MRLTDDQWGLLCLASEGEVDTTWGHPDVVALASLGLITVRRLIPGGAFPGGQVVKITPAGLAALSPAGEGGN